MSAALALAPVGATYTLAQLGFELVQSFDLSDRTMLVVRELVGSSAAMRAKADTVGTRIDLGGVLGSMVRAETYLGGGTPGKLSDLCIFTVKLDGAYGRGVRSLAVSATRLAAIATAAHASVSKAERVVRTGLAALGVETTPAQRSELYRSVGSALAGESADNYERGAEVLLTKLAAMGLAPTLDAPAPAQTLAVVPRYELSDGGIRELAHEIRWLTVSESVSRILARVGAQRERTDVMVPYDRARLSTPGLLAGEEAGIRAVLAKLNETAGTAPAAKPAETFAVTPEQIEAAAKELGCNWGEKARAVVRAFARVGILPPGALVVGDVPQVFNEEQRVSYLRALCRTVGASFPADYESRREHLASGRYCTSDMLRALAAAGLVPVSTYETGGNKQPANTAAEGVLFLRAVLAAYPDGVPYKPLPVPAPKAPAKPLDVEEAARRAREVGEYAGRYPGVAGLWALTAAELIPSDIVSRAGIRRDSVGAWLAAAFGKPAPTGLDYWTASGAVVKGLEAFGALPAGSGALESGLPDAGGGCSTAYCAALVRAIWALKHAPPKAAPEPAQAAPAVPKGEPTEEQIEALAKANVPRACDTARDAIFALYGINGTALTEDERRGVHRAYHAGLSGGQGTLTAGERAAIGKVVAKLRELGKLPAEPKPAPVVRKASETKGVTIPAERLERAAQKINEASGMRFHDAMRDALRIVGLVPPAGAAPARTFGKPASVPESHTLTGDTVREYELSGVLPEGATAADNRAFGFATDTKTARAALEGIAALMPADFVLYPEATQPAPAPAAPPAPVKEPNRYWLRLDGGGHVLNGEVNHFMLFKTRARAQKYADKVARQGKPCKVEVYRSAAQFGLPVALAPRNADVSTWM